MPVLNSPLLSSDRFAAMIDGLPLVPRPSGQAARKSAATLVRDGTIVSMGDQPAVPAQAGDEPPMPGAPAPYRLRQWRESAEGWVAVNDRLSVDIHGAASMTHIDTTEHFSWGSRRMTQPEEGALIRLAREGLVGRGVLVDVPAQIGRPLEPDEVISVRDLEVALDATGASVMPGDALYLSFGRRSPARSDVPLGSVAISGLSIDCAAWMAEHRPAVVITDEGLDPFPSEVEGLAVPWHVLLLTVLDIPLVDRAMLNPLSVHCAEVGRWEFLSVIAPLAIPGASGSPVNPLAIF
jgi:kynurenine formamidase